MVFMGTNGLINYRVHFNVTRLLDVPCYGQHIQTDPHATHTNTHFPLLSIKVSNTHNSILVFFFFTARLFSMRKALVFQVRRRPSTQTAERAEPVMDRKWTAVDRREDGESAGRPAGGTPNSQVLFCQ